LQIALEVFARTQNIHYLHNQSILIDPSGHILWTYDKTHPVPYGEAFVTVSGPGKLPVVATPYGRMSTAICYDTYYPALIRQAGENHTDIFLAPTNDSQPFAASALVMASYRAIENGFSMVRPTGNGLSAVIDTRGRVLSVKDYFKTGSGILLASVPTQGVTTIYSRIGDIFAELSAAGLVFMMVWALMRRKEPATISTRQTA
jgi:apolipoprotein N-acyltransferase